MENTYQVSHLPKFLCIFLFPLINLFPFPLFFPLTPSPLHVSCLLNSSVLYLRFCLQCPTPSGFQLVLVFRCKQKQDKHRLHLVPWNSLNSRWLKGLWGTWNSGGAIVFQVQPGLYSPFLLAARQARTGCAGLVARSSIRRRPLACAGERQADATNCLQPALHWGHSPRTSCVHIHFSKSIFLLDWRGKSNFLGFFSWSSVQ